MAGSELVRVTFSIGLGNAHADCPGLNKVLRIPTLFLRMVFGMRVVRKKRIG
jgi:hypothetical protein